MKSSSSTNFNDSKQIMFEVLADKLRRYASVAEAALMGKGRAHTEDVHEEDEDKIVKQRDERGL